MKHIKMILNKTLIAHGFMDHKHNAAAHAFINKYIIILCELI